MPRYTPVIFDSGCTRADRERVSSLFADTHRFNPPIIMSCGGCLLDGYVTATGNTEDPAFLLSYSVAVASERYPYDPLFIVETSVGSERIETAIGLIDNAVHSVMRGYPVILEPSASRVKIRMTIGKTTFPASVADVQDGIVVLAATETLRELISAHDAYASYIVGAELLFRHSARTPDSERPEENSSGAVKGLDQVFTTWITAGHSIGRTSSEKACQVLHVRDMDDEMLAAIMNAEYGKVSE